MGVLALELRLNGLAAVEGRGLGGRGKSLIPGEIPEKYASGAIARVDLAALCGG
jgi:hypothetical protein